ncbi:MAG: transketolase [Myxococcota bacterium]|jgi:transketolase|nr:transketolase [Myxococcota bacterium]
MTKRPPEEVLQRKRGAEAESLRRAAEELRLAVIEMINRAGLGHYSSTFSAAEILTVLYRHTLRLKPSDPAWPDRDRFLLGKGHIAVGLWPLLAELGFFPTHWLEAFGKKGARLQDHPDMHSAPGIDFSSGSLGHNLSVGVGMAIAARLQKKDHRIFVMLGDGELHEGQVWEAAMSAPHFDLGNLVAIVDANGSCASGETSSIMNIEPVAGRFEAFGWRTVEIDGHDVSAIVRAFDGLPDPTDVRPTCIVARTLKGKGVSFMEAEPRKWHVGFLGTADRARAIDEIKERL